MPSCLFLHDRFQIVALPDGVDSGANNGSWRLGDWADTLELPNIGYEAIVRWVPGPIEITGMLHSIYTHASCCYMPLISSRYGPADMYVSRVTRQR